ncbi:hypothetical protein NQU59_11245 [Acinetobacter colistiniresistens]|uniref:hypothetical protein n=1 Tax=Acinetobacter colistiniresistens TaxID=280145 RepID=UPI00211CEF0A|nr:hypothetical protein [Acinetobacter colistiniresistens]UUM26283.1 hypothetical protein NQU59_11245 [Acinetobacter colistiniresistens]
MATDIKVQFFSHLNGINLGNNWGDLIRMLDTCLVNGLPFTSVTAASIDANGDINLTFFAAHNAVLFQIVELSGFSPSNINGKYRIKGLPTSTQMILKAELSGKSITANGSAKLAALGYDIIFRDTNDVKRVYRAKNPSSLHPFIRVDESISDGTNSYNSAYAKFAMVGLLENMSHINDYEDPNKLQLPLDTSNFKRNWQITGTGTTVVRGWSRWYWARNSNVYNGSADQAAPSEGNIQFTFCGDEDAFYFIRPYTPTINRKVISGCGIFNAALDSSIVSNWFLMTTYNAANASFGQDFSSGIQGGLPLALNENTSCFLTTKYTVNARIANTDIAKPIVFNYASGGGAFNSSQVAALEIPFRDNSGFLRGTLKHVLYSGNSRGGINTTPLISDTSMYVTDSILAIDFNPGGLYFYLGELE